MQNINHNLLLFCATTWSSYHVIENHLLAPRTMEPDCLCSLRPHSTLVSVRNQPLVTEILFAGPLLPGNLDICNIPSEQIRELTIDLSGKFDKKSKKESRRKLFKARLGEW